MCFFDGDVPERDAGVERLQPLVPGRTEEREGSDEGSRAHARDELELRPGARRRPAAQEARGVRTLVAAPRDCEVRRGAEALLVVLFPDHQLAVDAGEIVLLELLDVGGVLREIANPHRESDHRGFGLELVRHSLAPHRSRVALENEHSEDEEEEDGQDQPARSTAHERRILPRRLPRT